MQIKCMQWKVKNAQMWHNRNCVTRRGFATFSIQITSRPPLESLGTTLKQLDLVLMKNYPNVFFGFYSILESSTPNVTQSSSKESSHVWLSCHYVCAHFFCFYISFNMILGFLDTYGHFYQVQVLKAQFNLGFLLTPTPTF